MNFYNQSQEEVLSALNSQRDGLSSQEAQERLEKNGKNKLAEGKKESMIHRFLKQLAEPMTIILIVAAVISGVLAIVEKEFPSDVIIIMAVVLINAILGVFQESKAEKAIEALQEIAAATSKVIRDGKLIVVKSEDLVVGDIIVSSKDNTGTQCTVYIVSEGGRLLQMNSSGATLLSSSKSDDAMEALLAANSFAVLRPSLSFK